MSSPNSPYPKLLSVQRIWDRAPHNAFTDLMYYKGTWLCVFRESITHGAGDEGQVRLIRSSDGLDWSSVDLFVLPDADLRDPKLSIMPDGRLMLLMGRTLKREGYLEHSSCVAFSEDVEEWSPIQPILGPGEWLWRVTWHGGTGYGISYSFTDPRDSKQPWQVKLWKTTDGIAYSLVTELDVLGYPSESTLRMRDDGQMVALVRREAATDGGAWLGLSQDPFVAWEWRPLGFPLDGPDFVMAGDTLWAAGRIPDPSGADKPLVTALCRIDESGSQPVLILPSGGDNSYPGLVLRDKILWMSYYSSHEEKSAIYLAQIELEA